MFNLDKVERFVVIILLLTLILGLGVSMYKKYSHRDVIEIKNFTADYPLEKEKLDINEAGIEEFMSLKGVGKTLSGRIIDYRNQNGPFRSIGGLKDVKGIGEKLFEKVKDKISVRLRN